MAAAGSKTNEAWGRNALEDAWAKLREEQTSGKAAQIEGIRSNREAEARGDRRTASRARKQDNAWGKQDSVDAWAKLRDEAAKGNGASIGGLRSNEDLAKRGRLGPGNGTTKDRSDRRGGTQVNRSASRPAGEGPLAGLRRAFEALVPEE